MNASRFPMFVCVVACVCLVPTPAVAAIFAVNSIADVVDANPGDGICSSATPGECTLRAAVQEANASAGADTIVLPAGIFVLGITGSGGDEVGSLDLTDDVSIVGQGKDASIVDGSNMEYAIFEVHDPASADFRRVTVRNCDCLFAGISNDGTLKLDDVGINGNRRGVRSTTFTSVTMTNSTVSGNGPRGGIESFGTMIIRNSVISDNVEDWDGYGGGIKNIGSMVVENSTISGNYASLGGGGLHSRDDIKVINSTISGNRTDGSGGAFYLIAFDPMKLYNVTIAANEAPAASAIFISATSDNSQVTNTIIADNLGGNNCGIYGDLTSLGGNLGDDSTCNLVHPSDMTNIDPLLGPLEDNGGAAATHALLDGSPAIDAVAAGCFDILSRPLLDDQRGRSRPNDGNGDGIVACDIGAYESQAFTTVVGLPDINGNGSAEVGVLFDEATHNLQIRDGDTGDLINDVDFGTDPAAALTVIDDISGNAVPELALLGTRPDGSVRVQIRDSATGTAINNIFYGAAYSAVDLGVLPDTDANGAVELLVVGLSDADGVRAQARDALTDAPTSTTWYGTRVPPMGVLSIPDLSLNGQPEVLMHGRVRSSYQGMAQCRDSADKTLLRNFFFGTQYTPIRLVVIQDVSGDGIPDLAQLARQHDSGAARVRVKQTDTGATVANAFLGSTDLPVDIIGIGDANSNGAPDVAVLVERPDGTAKVVIRDGASGAFIRNIFAGAVSHPVAVALVEDLDSSGDPELAILGYDDSGSRKVQIRDSIAGTPVNIIDFP